MKSLLIVNSISGVIQTVCSSILICVTIPVFIRLLGSDAYGLFSLAMVIGNLNTFVNLGLTTSLMKYLSEQGKDAESTYDIVVTLILLSAAILPFTLIGLLFNKFVLREVFVIPSAMMSEGIWLFSFLLIANLFLMIGQAFNAILDAQQKIHVTNALQMLYNLVYWGLILLVLLMGYSLKAIGIMACVSAILWFVAVATVSLHSWGTLRVQGFSTNFWRVVRKQTTYGFQIYLGGLIGFFYEPFTKILLSHFLGVMYVGYFDIGLKLRNQAWALMSKMLYPLYPLMAQLQNKSKIRFLVHDLEQKALFLVAPVIAVCVYNTQPLIKLWIGANVQIISTTAIAVLASYLLGSTVIPNYQYLLVKGRASKTIILQGLNVAVNAILFLVTYSWLGYYAVVVGNVGAILTTFSVSLYYQKKYLNSLILDSWDQLFRLVSLFVSCCTIAIVIKSISNSALLQFILIPISICSVAILGYRMLRLFTPEDISRYAGEHKWLMPLSKRVLCAA